MDGWMDGWPERPSVHPSTHRIAQWQSYTTFSARSGQRELHQQLPDSTLALWTLLVYGPVGASVDEASVGRATVWGEGEGFKVLPGLAWPGLVLSYPAR
jgi:hypothetical protein